MAVIVPLSIHISKTFLSTYTYHKGQTYIQILFHSNTKGKQIQFCLKENCVRFNCTEANQNTQEVKIWMLSIWTRQNHVHIPGILGTPKWFFNFLHTKFQVPFLERSLIPELKNIYIICVNQLEKKLWFFSYLIFDVLLRKAALLREHQKSKPSQRMIDKIIW